MKNEKETVLKTNEAVDLYFIALHLPTNTEIRMPVLSICEEYSSISFNTLPNEYDGDYNGIGRLPSYVGNDSADDYEIYIVINGVKCLYRGLQYSPKEDRKCFKGEWLDGGFYARRVSFKNRTQNDQ
jgi:hypothetical protein